VDRRYLDHANTHVANSHSEICILIYIYLCICGSVLQVNIVQFFPPFTATANNAVRARRAFATKKSISISYRAITRSKCGLFLVRAPSPSYISISAKRTEREKSFFFSSVCVSFPRSLGCSVPLIERLQGTLRRNVREVTEKKKELAGIDGSTRGFIHERNVQGGLSYSDGCFRGNHVRLYRVPPSPPSRRIERYNL